MSDYRWIMYMHQPLPGAFEVTRCASLGDAREQLRQYGENTGFHEQVTASLYPYSAEDWAEAEEFATIGCPFDYPSKLIDRGPKGGMVITNA